MSESMNNSNTILKEAGFTPYFNPNIELLIQVIKDTIGFIHPVGSNTFIKDSIQVTEFNNIKAIKRMLKNVNGKIIINNISYENPLFYKLRILIGLNHRDLFILNSTDSKEPIEEVNIHIDTELNIEYIFMLDNDLNINILDLEFAYEYKQDKFNVLHTSSASEDVNMKFMHTYTSMTNSFEGNLIPFTADYVSNDITISYGSLMKFVGVKILSKVQVQSYNHFEEVIQDPAKLEMNQNHQLTTLNIF